MLFICVKGQLTLAGETSSFSGLQWTDSDAKRDVSLAAALKQRNVS